MKLLIITATAAFSMLTATAQTFEKRNAENVTQLEVKNGIEVIVTQGEKPELKVETKTTALLNNVITEFKRGTLKISLKNMNGAVPHIKVFVTEPYLNKITVSNGGSVKIDSVLNVEEMQANISGGAIVTGEINTVRTFNITATSGGVFRGVVHAEVFNAEAKNGAVIKVVGSAGTIKAYSSGGTVHAGKLLTKNATVTANNGAAIFVYTTDKIKADTDAASTITYYGDPKEAITGTETYSIYRETEKLTLNK